MIKSYVGKTHEVVTSVGIRFHEYQKIEMHKTLVTFAQMTDEEIQHYLSTGGTGAPTPIPTNHFRLDIIV